jgi:hypothetical protein
MGSFFCETYRQELVTIIGKFAHPNTMRGPVNGYAAIPHLRDKITAREIDIEEGNIVFLLARTHYRTHLRQAFPAAQYWTWKAFRMREVNCVCCRK